MTDLHFTDEHLQHLAGLLSRSPSLQGVLPATEEEWFPFLKNIAPVRVLDFKLIAEEELELLKPLT